MILTLLMSRIAGLLALLSLALCCVDVALSEEVDVQTGQTFRDCSECPEMVVISAGSFLLGSSAEEAARDLEYVVPKNELKSAKQSMTFERPQHQVNFSRAFAIGKQPVTRGQFADFVREAGYSVENGCTVWIDHTYPFRPDAGWQSPGFSQTDGDPVVCVNRDDIKAYLAWLNSKLPGRTPSEGDEFIVCRARRSGSMQRARVRGQRGGGAVPSVRATPIATDAAAAGTKNKRRQPVVSELTRSGSRMCSVTYGKVLRTAGTRPMSERQKMGVPDGGGVRFAGDEGWRLGQSSLGSPYRSP